MNSSHEKQGSEQTISPIALLKSFKVTNCFDFDKLKQIKLNEITDSHLYTGGAFLVKGKDYFELFFGVGETTLLKESVTHLLSSSLICSPIKTVIIGKKPYIEKLTPIFLDLGFTLLKRQARMDRTHYKQDRDKTVEKIDHDQEVEIDEADKNITADLAKQSEVNDIFFVLSERFDFYKDNLPDVDEIADNIKKKQVMVLKDSGRIIGVLYYEIKSNSYYGLFDAVKKEYKNRFVFRYLHGFQQKYFKANNIKPIRLYGWRDIDNKRLMAYSKLQGEKPDGVYLYNFLYNP